MFVIAIVSHYSKKTFKTLPFLSGVIAGYVLSLIMTGLGYATNVDALKLIDFAIFNRIDWLPDFSIVYALDGAVANGFTWSQIPAILLVSVPISFVAMCEHIGDHMNLSGIVERDLLKDPGLTYTLIGDGVATALGGVVSGLGNTTYGENVAVIGLSRVASVRVVQVAALIAVLFGFAAPIMLWVSSIPYAVFGGAALILYGFIAVSGLKQLKVVDLNDNRNIIIISVILIAGVGGLFIQFGGFTFSGTALAMIIGVVLNLVLRPQKNTNSNYQYYIKSYIKRRNQTAAILNLILTGGTKWRSAFLFDKMENFLYNYIAGKNMYLKYLF